MPIDAVHVARIQAALRSLGEIEPARAMLVLEDAYVACAMGRKLGLTMPQIIENACDCIDEVLQDNGPSSQAGDTADQRTRTK